jgi:hypothetical protein
MESGVWIPSSMRRRANGVVGSLAAIAVVLWSLCVLASPAEGAGPWRAQIVDAETGQPIEGVVVLAYWFRYLASPGGWAAGKYHAADEVVTGPDGRFEVPSRIVINWLPVFAQIQGPEFKIFKPGYGQWQMRTPAYKPDGDGVDPADLFREEGVVIALPPLKTREERLKFYGSAGFGLPGGIPLERRKRFRAAEDEERSELGFKSIERSGK